MPTDRLQPIWTPEDAREVFERATTFHAERGVPADQGADVIDLFTRAVQR